MNDPLVSIIIPVYNRAHLVGETLFSIQQQTYVHWECIVVDDHSTDKTVEVVTAFAKTDSRFKIFKRPDHKPKGANACRNYGLEVSRGTLINWFDSDDLMVREKLEIQVDVLLNNSALMFCYGLYAVYNGEMENGKISYFDTDSLLIDYLIGQAYINLPVCIFKKSFIGDQRLDEKIHKAQEFEFFNRLFNRDSLLYYKIDQELVKVRSHQQSITNSYNNANLRAMRSEFVARLKSFDTLKEKGGEKYLTQGISAYLKYLSITFKNKHRRIYMNYLLRLFPVVTGKEQFFKLTKILLYSLLFMITGKGYSRWKIHIMNFC
jgi:glycosyltransferase involved in cell wall biosynthesis